MSRAEEQPGVANVDDRCGRATGLMDHDDTSGQSQPDVGVPALPGERSPASVPIVWQAGDHSEAATARQGTNDRRLSWLPMPMIP